jgi:hypothetical protein
VDGGSGGRYSDRSRGAESALPTTLRRTDLTRMQDLDRTRPFNCFTDERLLMAKKTSKPESSPKLYACCTDPKCKRLHQLVDLLKLWGIDREMKEDANGWYFDVSVPSYWNDHRRERFARAIANPPTGQACLFGQ